MDMIPDLILDLFGYQTSKTEKQRRMFKIFIIGDIVLFVAIVFILIVIFAQR